MPDLDLSVLDELGAGLEDAMRRRVRRTRTRRLALTLGAGGVALALVVATFGFGGGSSRSFLARAYGAVSNPGVAHWRLDIRYRVGGRLTAQRQRVEGWQRGGVVHVLRSERFGRGPLRLQSDTRVAGGRERVYLAATGDTLSLPAPPARLSASSSPIGDPVQTFRVAYRHGTLHRVSGTTYSVDFVPARLRRSRGSQRVTYTFDRASARLRRITVTSSPAAGARAPRSVQISDVSVYETLAPRPAALQELDLLPHPPVKPTDAAASFAVLRDGPPATAAQRAALVRLDTIARRDPQAIGHGVDPGAARQVAPGAVLAASGTHLCLYTIARRGVGVTCKSTRAAVKAGLGLGLPADGMTLVVADDVHSVRAPAASHGFATYAVHDNVVLLPKLGGRIRLNRR